MGVVGALHSGRRRITGQHLVGPPPRKAHQVTFLSPSGEPAMRERVTEAVGVHPLDASQGGPAAQHAVDTAGCHRPPLTEPQAFA